METRREFLAGLMGAAGLRHGLGLRLGMGASGAGGAMREVEYLESDGGSVLMRTGLTIQDGDTVALGFAVIETPFTVPYPTVMGCTSPNYDFGVFAVTSIGMRYVFGDDWQSWYTMPLDVKTEATKTAVLRGEETNELCLFGRRQRNGTLQSGGKSRLYYVRITRGGEIVADIVAAVGADGAAMFFDKARGIEIRNEGTGMVTAGPDK